MGGEDVGARAEGAGGSLGRTFGFRLHRIQPYQPVAYHQEDPRRIVGSVRRLLGTALVVVLGALASCSSDGDNSSTAESSETPGRNDASVALDSFPLTVCIGVNGGNLEEATVDGIDYNDDVQLSDMRDALEGMVEHCGTFGQSASESGEGEIALASNTVARSAQDVLDCLDGLDLSNPICTDQLKTLSDEFFALRVQAEGEGGIEPTAQDA